MKNEEEEEERSTMTTTKPFLFFFFVLPSPFRVASVKDQLLPRLVLTCDGEVLRLPLV